MVFKKAYRNVCFFVVFYSINNYTEEVISLFIFIFGLFVGSFLNVIIDRLPRGENFFKGRSYCDTCKHLLSWKDLIPLFSFIVLRGKCRYCKTRLSYQYPLLEVLTGTAFTLTYLFITPSNPLSIIYSLLITSILIVIFFVDLFDGIIPFVLVIPGMVLALFYLLLSGNISQVFIHIVAALLAGGFFYLIYFITKRKGMGFGDVVFGLFMGLLLGLPNSLLALYIAFLTGGIFSLILVLLRRKKLRGSTIPFGPFLVVGTYSAFLWGDLMTNYILEFLL